MIGPERLASARIGEISCPTKYFEEASSINFQRSVTYGFGVLRTALDLRLKRWGLAKPAFLADAPSERLAALAALTVTDRPLPFEIVPSLTTTAAVSTL